MSIAEIEHAIETLPRQQVESLREWIEDYLEDQRELAPAFSAKIARAEQEMAAGQGRVRNATPS